MKRKVVLGIIILGLIATMFGTISVNAVTRESQSSKNKSTISSKKLEPTEVLKNTISFINAHDWNGYYSLTGHLCDDGILNTEYAQNNRIGACNLKSIHLLKYKEIKVEDVSDIVDLKKYPSEYSDIRLYYIAVDCSTYSENEYFHNGVNYFVYVIGYNGSKYKLLQASQPILEDTKNIMFGDSEEKIQIFIQKEAQKGNIIGSDGRLINTNKSTEKQLMQDEGDFYNEYYSQRIPLSRYEYKGTNGLTIKEYVNSEANVMAASSVDDPIDPATHPYPSSIKVLIKSSQTISVVNFTTYIKNVVPNEWSSYQKDTSTSTWYTMPISALQAGAMAVKGYGWHRVYSHLYPNSGYDVKDDANDQVYKAGTANTRCSTAVDAVAGRMIVNSDNKLFPTVYLAGYYSSFGVALGTAFQNGSAYLANLSGYYDWFTILAYYYDNSLRSPNGNCKYYYY